MSLTWPLTWITIFASPLEIRKVHNRKEIQESSTNRKTSKTYWLFCSWLNCLLVKVLKWLSQTNPIIFARTKWYSIFFDCFTWYHWIMLTYYCKRTISIKLIKDFKKSIFHQFICMKCTNTSNALKYKNNHINIFSV